MTVDQTPFMDFRALIIGTLALCMISFVMMGAGVLLGVERATVPQLLTLSALWIGPGAWTALQAKDGRLLHGMVMGLAGGLLTVLLAHLLLAQTSGATFLNQLAGDKWFVWGLIGGLWGCTGGIFAEILHLRRMKQKAKESARH